MIPSDSQDAPEQYREQGRQEVWALFMDKFADLHDQYYAQGDEVACNLVVDLVAWMQDDWEGISDKGI
jgi:hypothetical protein